MTHRTMLALALLLALAPVTVDAQGARDTSGARAPGEARLRQRFGAVLQQRLGLNDEQARRLGETSRRFEVERRRLLTDERQLRLQLRDEMAPGATPNQERVDDALGRMIALQRQRVDLLEREQREMAGYMTPVQRARYLAFQDEARRRVDDARRRRGAKGGQAGAPRRPRPAAP